MTNDIRELAELKEELLDKVEQKAQDGNKSSKWVNEIQFVPYFSSTDGPLDEGKIHRSFDAPEGEHPEGSLPSDWFPCVYDFRIDDEIENVNLL